MNKLKKLIFSSRTNIAIFAVIAVFVLIAIIGVAHAAMTYPNETYGSEVSMNSIGVSLVENGTLVSHRDYTGRNNEWDVSEGALLTHMLDETGGELEFGHTYNEQLNVYNSGNMDEYVRATVYRYWENPNKLNDKGKPVKMTNLDISLIDLHLLADNGNGWTIDPYSINSERTVLYYQRILPVGESTPLFADTLTIRDNDGTEAIFGKATTTSRTDENGNTIYTITYEYDDIRFILKVDVDAVQTHNAADAIKSAWGINMYDYGIQ